MSYSPGGGASGGIQGAFPLRVASAAGRFERICAQCLRGRLCGRQVAASPSGALGGDPFFGLSQRMASFRSG